MSRVKITPLILVTAMSLFLLTGCGNKQNPDPKEQLKQQVSSLEEEARKQLEEMGIQVTPDAFVQAINQRDFEKAKLLLEAGTNPNVNIDWRSALQMAMVSSKEGSDDIVKVMIEKGANPNGDKKFFPLMKALEDNKLEIITLLIEKGADINKKDKGGSTPLIRAVSLGNTEAVELLINKGADTNIENIKNHDAMQGSDGKLHDIQERITALAVAMDKVKMEEDVSKRQGYEKIVQLLIDAGAEEKSKYLVDGKPYNKEIK